MGFPCPLYFVLFVRPSLPTKTKALPNNQRRLNVFGRGHFFYLSFTTNVCMCCLVCFSYSSWSLIDHIWVFKMVLRYITLLNNMSLHCVVEKILGIIMSFYVWFPLQNEQYSTWALLIYAFELANRHFVGLAHSNKKNVCVLVSKMNTFAPTHIELIVEL